MAFYFLLRVGEYTKPWTVRRDGKCITATRTNQFVVGNVGFFRDGIISPRTLSLDVILTEDLATLKISNQKNGRMGQTITQHATDRVMCPVRALVHIVHNILSEGGDNETLLCSVKNNTEWVPVESHHMVAAVRENHSNFTSRQSTWIWLELIHCAPVAPWRWNYMVMTTRPSWRWTGGNPWPFWNISTTR